MRDKPLHLRIKFNAADRNPSGTFAGAWSIGVPQKTAVWKSEVMSLSPDTFHVAAFFSLGLLSVVLASGTMANAVAEGTLGGWNAEKGTKGSTPVDFIVIPTFKGVLTIINLAKDFSPIDSLSTGRNISWGQLGLAFGQIVLLLGGVFAAFGMFVFTRRELATAQGTQ